jgi:hypothetical protein
VRGPVVLLGCGEPASFELWNSFTHETTALDLSRCESHNHAIGLGVIGRYWIAGSYDTGYYDWTEEGAGHEVYDVVYLNRASGECRVYPDGYNRNIDRADLPRPRYGVPDRCTRGKKFILDFRPRGLYTKLCTKHAPWRRSGCGDGAIGRNLIACFERARLRVYLPVSGRRLSWRAHGSGFPTVLGDHVYVAVYDDGSPGASIYTVDLARLVGR